MKTVSTNAKNVKRRWFVVDAKRKRLGRMATAIATILRGKNKPEYTPHVDTGDFVVVINAEEIELTGNKWEGKMYHRHTGWVGSVISQSAAKVRETKPEKLIEDAVWGMLPKGPLGRTMFSKLKVYAGPEHPHAAQQPEVLVL